MRIKNYESRIKQLEDTIGNKRDTVKLVYVNGDSETVTESIGVIAKEIEQYFDWCNYVEGKSHKVPDLLLIVNQRTGEVWNLKESAGTEMSDEEVDEIIKKIEEAVKHNG